MKMLKFKINPGSFSAAGDAVLGSMSRLPFSWHGVSALILGVLLAKWFWILFAPHATFTSATPERSAGLEAGSLFGVVATTETASQGVALPNVKLLGVFTASRNRAGFAILKVDEKRQVGVAEGEEVAAGTKLVSVHADHVVLERTGVQQTVPLEDKYAASPNKGILPAYGAAARTQAINEATDAAAKVRSRQMHR
jgi:type II secretory pathway component PulC